jgi:hypothetical protein
MKDERVTRPDSRSPEQNADQEWVSLKIMKKCELKEPSMCYIKKRNFYMLKMSIEQ